MGLVFCRYEMVAIVSYNPQQVTNRILHDIYSYHREYMGKTLKPGRDTFSFIQCSTAHTAMEMLEMVMLQPPRSVHRLVKRKPNVNQ